MKKTDKSPGGKRNWVNLQVAFNTSPHFGQVISRIPRSGAQCEHLNIKVPPLPYLIFFPSPFPSRPFFFSSPSPRQSPWRSSYHRGLLQIFISFDFPRLSFGGDRFGGPMGGIWMPWSPTSTTPLIMLVHTFFFNNFRKPFWVFEQQYWLSFSHNQRYILFSLNVLLEIF